MVSRFDRRWLLAGGATASAGNCRRIRPRGPGGDGTSGAVTDGPGRNRVSTKAPSTAALWSSRSTSRSRASARPLAVRRGGCRVRRRGELQQTVGPQGRQGYGMAGGSIWPSQVWIA